MDYRTSFGRTSFGRNSFGVIKGLPLAVLMSVALWIPVIAAVQSHWKIHL